MEQQVIAPKADQPRVTTENLKRGEQPAQLEYRSRGFQSYNRSPGTRVYGRNIR